jgi:hypothetical protein
MRIVGFQMCKRITILSARSQLLVRQSGYRHTDDLEVSHS